MNSIRLLCVKILLLLCVGLPMQLVAQTNDNTTHPASASRAITGTVTDQTGEPIIGATIKVKGTNTGTITDFDGQFTIHAGATDKIQVAYMGYVSQELEVRGNNSFRVTLIEDAKSLDEVVVIGYGSVKKSNLTTAVSKIGADAIKDRPLSTLSEAFSGQVPGVQTQIASGLPGEDLQISIRGTNSITGASPPLYVIDGVISESINDVNPGDVESIQILKDASATAIYGARGSNGVVLVETKRARKGAPVISFEATYGLQQADRLPEVMSPKEWFAYNIWYINAAYLNRGGDNSMSVPNKLRPEGDRIPEEWLLNPDSDTPDWRLNPNVSQTNWIDAILRTAAVQNYQVSAQGSSDLGNIFVSGGYLNQEGIVRNTGYERINLRMNGTLNLRENLRVGASFAPSTSNQDRGETEGKDKVIMYALQYPPLMSMDSGTRDKGFDPNYPNNVNQYDRLMSVTDKKEETRLSASAWLEYDIIKDLRFKTIYSLNTRNTIYEYFLPANVVAPNAKGGQVSKGTSRPETYKNWSLQNVLTYDKVLAGKHTLNLMAGQSVDDISIYRADLEGTGWPLENVYTLNLSTTPVTSSTVRYKARTASFFGRVSYDFADKYLFSASFRSDGSSRFGPGNRWGFFPSFSGGWKINEERFMKNVSFINLLKVRASWGMSGNDRIGYNDYLSTYDVTTGVYGGREQAGMYPKNFSNPDLKWESTQATNLGFDLSMFANRVQFNFDYYINKTEDLLYNLQIPYTTGFSTMRTNSASIENRGWEIDLTTMNIAKKDFSWSTSLNLSKTKNKILDLGGIDNIITEAWNAYFLTKVGGPVSQFYTFRTDGLLTEDDFEKGPDGKYDKTKPLVPIMNNQIPGNYRFVDQNNDKKIDDDDRVAYGNNVPDLLFGITNRFAYKGFTLSIFLQGQLGGDIYYLASRNLDRGRRMDNQLVRWLNCYKDVYAGGDPIPHELGVDMSWDGKTPNPWGIGANGVNENTTTDQRIYDATFLKIKNISLAYSIPAKHLQSLRISSARVNLSIENLHTFTNYVGNPETNSYNPNNPMLKGVDYSTYPLTRKYTIGVNLTF